MLQVQYSLATLCRDIWEKCKEPQQGSWYLGKLVGAEGNHLCVFGSTVVKLSIKCEGFKLPVVIALILDL